jgi:AcrR family transcriptional regulator
MDTSAFVGTNPSCELITSRELTLAHVAAEADLRPGLLVQRFGSKRELLLALAERLARSAPKVLQQLRVAQGSPSFQRRRFFLHPTC